mmetsp:Transcript_49100/g.95975  ORF Transcript_49100/g.95975 Transcript_49100/m.95975 type:complete len:179 (+) Transcript_49100:88-624(+)|eukprot:CAMPEP_0194316938 /NCGR_PEP_ID=MMETSP0171-20130528/13684_1 /TAXON_ID=218684 /ORGANISM="Corethron pennatum, Strain L29A3" /LENGTH=178 /DNA_ID=CAMNT_0039073345 /DNA_START=45 /DNA_END=581 /DNA_ORIENTATION=-
MISLRAPLSLLLLLLHLSLLPSASAATAFDVNWVIPDGDALTPLSVTVGDTLTFTWTGYHNVYIHPSGTCKETDRREVGSAEDSGIAYEFTAEDLGTVTFACDVMVHCGEGQILVVTVTEGDSDMESITDAIEGATGETDAVDAALLGEAQSGAMANRGGVLSIQFLSAVLIVLLLVK